MHITDIFAAHRPTFSFEFFPPKTAQGAEALFETARALEPLKPSFVSMTYGAGGSTRDLTHDLVVRLKQETSLVPMPHLTCVCHSEAEIADILGRYAKAGISNILALGGDPPRNVENYRRAADRFQRAADLVGFISDFGKQRLHPDPRGFGIGVAGFPEGHPATPNRLQEMDFLKAKVDAGADFIITQLFFDNHDFLDFRERCDVAGIRVPIIAGIMPVQSVEHMARMAELASGARYPARLQRAVRRCGEDRDAISRVGIHWATEQCADLIDQGVAGLHFYTLNKSTATLDIYRNLGVQDSAGLRH
ncbi:MAG: methylenetetrahydrofolate reductase [Pseudomonadota bacterium]|jgi:methylenetetrahydrofolate reductase (NADPH)